MNWLVTDLRLWIVNAGSSFQFLFSKENDKDEDEDEENNLKF